MATKADIENPISLLRPANAKIVQKILDRANKVVAAESRATVRQAGQVKTGASRNAKAISRTLGLALAFHGRATKGAASMKQKAPDTGGRTFHFSYSMVSRHGGGSGHAGREGTTASGAAASGSGGGEGTSTQEAAHQAYVERDSAVAPDHEAVMQEPGAGWGAGTGRVGPERGRDRDDGGREPGQGQNRGTKQAEIDQERAMEAVAAAAPSAHANSARAAQAYVEDEKKLGRRFGHANSFGTIGETAEKRLVFWDLVHEHEREKDARTQARLVLELPHEADAKTRQEIVRQYCAWFEDNGIPYWAAIHQPTEDNDSRNYHAHVVYMDRPAKRIAHLETGETVWDFTIQVKKKDKTRHTKIVYPYRQKKLNEMRHYGFVKESRARFAQVANAVLEKSTCKVRYDPRSYRDMGLDVEPMVNVSRIFADKMKSHDFVAMDVEWTRRMIKQEMEAAALARDKTLRQLAKVEKQLREATRDIRRPNTANRNLPPSLRVGPDSIITPKAAETIVASILRNQRDRLAEQFVRENTRRAIAHVVAATAPTSDKRKGAARKAYAKAGVEAPDPEAMATLHAAATQELREFDLATRSWRMRTANAARRAYDLWHRSANPSRYQPRPAPPLPSEPAAAAMPPAMPRPPMTPPAPTGWAAAMATNAPRAATAPAPHAGTAAGAQQRGAAARRPAPIPGLDGFPAAPAMPPLQADAPGQKGPVTNEEYMNAILGPPNSKAQKLSRLMKFATDSIAQLQERGLMGPVDETSMREFLQSFKTGILNHGAKVAAEAAAQQAASQQGAPDQAKPAAGPGQQPVAPPPAAEAQQSQAQPSPGSPTPGQAAAPPVPAAPATPQVPPGTAKAGGDRWSQYFEGAMRRHLGEPPLERETPRADTPAEHPLLYAPRLSPVVPRRPQAAPAAPAQESPARPPAAEPQTPTQWPSEPAPPASPRQADEQGAEPAPPDRPKQAERPIAAAQVARAPSYRNPKPPPDKATLPPVDPLLTGLFDDLGIKPRRPDPADAAAKKAEVSTEGEKPTRKAEGDEAQENGGEDAPENRKKRRKRRRVILARHPAPDRGR